MNSISRSNSNYIITYKSQGQQLNNNVIKINCTFVFKLGCQYNNAKNKQLINLQTMQKKLNLVSSLAVKVNGIVGTMDINKNLNHLAFSGYMRFIHIIELKSYQIIQQLGIQNNGTSCVFYSKNNTLFSVAFECLLIFEYYDNQYNHTKTIQDQQFNGPTILKDDLYVISVIGQNNLYFQNYITNEKKIINFPQYSQLQAMAMNKTEDLLITGGQQGIYFFDLKNNRIKRRNPQLYVYKLQISNNSQIYLEETYQLLKLRSIQSHKIIRKFISDNNQCSFCQKFTKNDSFLILTGLDWKIRVYNIKFGILTIYEQNLGVLLTFQFQDYDQNIEFFCGTENGSVVKWSSI